MVAAPKLDARAAVAISIPALTGVRAIAALWVVLHHLRLGPARQLVLPDTLDAIGRYGYLGVDLFGFLSGFVIAHNYAERLAHERRTELAPYLWARLVRIAPAHWLVLALLVATLALVPGVPARPSERVLYRASELPLQILLLHGWSLGNPFAWNLPSWTVSAEWLCYLLFPCIAPWLARRRDGAQAVAFAAAVIAATAVAMRALGHPGWNAAMHGGVVRIAGEFLAGCLLQRAFAAGFAREAPWAALAALAAVAIGAAVTLAKPTVAVAGFAVLVLALAHQRGAIASVLASRPLVFLGDASYAVYISHWLVLALLAVALPAPLALPQSGADAASSLVAHLAAIFASGIALHVGFENPTRARLRRVVASPERI